MTIPVWETRVAFKSRAAQTVETEIRILSLAMVAARHLVPVATFRAYPSVRTRAIAKVVAHVLLKGSCLMRFRPTLAMLEANAARLMRLQGSPLLVPL